MGCGQSSTASRGNLTELKARLPVERTEEDQKKRAILYAKFDVRKSDSLTEEECLDGCKRHLEIDKLTDQLPLLNKRAFDASRAMRTRPDSTAGVDPSEFRLYLSYLRFYFELNEMFTEVDTSKTRQLTREEFKAGVPKLEKWGLFLGDPDEEFNDIGARGKGATFDEFSDWAIRKQLETNQRKDPADAAAERRANDKIVVPIPMRASAPEEGNYPRADARDLDPTAFHKASAPPAQNNETVIVRHVIVDEQPQSAQNDQNANAQAPPAQSDETVIVRHVIVDEDTQKVVADEHTAVEPMEPPAGEGHYTTTEVITTRVVTIGDGSPREDLTYAEEAAIRKVMWEDLKLRLPRQKTPEQNAARDELFKQFDPNGSGKLSYSEVENGAENILRLQDFTKDYKIILQRAFNTARIAGTRHGNKNDDQDFVERIEFRLLLVYIYDYFELWVMFDELDTSGDRKVSLQEFKHALPRLEEWGVKIEDPEATFASIDKDGSGVMSFDEFCEWAINCHLDADGEENQQ